MNFIINTINSLDIAGILLLIATLFPLRKLMQELPYGSIRKFWRILAGMILFFIATYIVIAIQFRTHSAISGREIICSVLFLGALFVLMVCILSLQTARDIKRIYTLEIENMTDPLMSISNRRHLDEKLVDEFSKASRYHLPLSILMIDIDHFKRINDNYGHEMGDLVLKKLGALIKTLVRETDTVARYGGEEIMVISPLTDGEHASWLGERLRHQIEHCIMLPEDLENDIKAVSVTVSIGIAEYTPYVSAVENLVKRADEAMYQAKRQGRNRVFMYGNPNPVNVR